MTPTTALSNKLFCIDEGSGLPVLLLHGFGEDHRVWNAQRLLHQEIRLLIPDLPGSGHSEPQANSSMEQLAHRMRELLDEKGIDQCLVLGHSMGGYIALALAALCPEKIKGLGLIHSTAFADSEEKKETRRKAITFIRSQGSEAFLKTSIPGLYGPRFSAAHPEEVRRHLQWSAHLSPSILIAYYEAMMLRPDRKDLLRNAQYPVLFVLGRHDIAVPLADGLAQSHLPFDSMVYLLEHAGHMGMREEAAKVTGWIRDFIHHAKRGMPDV